MMDGVNISKLGLLLTCLFSLFFLALLVEILFLLLSYRRHSTTASSSSDNNYQSSSSAKRIDFIHSFLKRQSAGRVELSGAPAVTRVSVSEPLPSSLPVEDLMKMEYYPRLLFTIQEEEREGIECYSSERSPSLIEDRRRQNKLNPDENFSAAGEESSTEIVRAHVDITPFETPCASPLDYYYTPSASPHG